MSKRDALIAKYAEELKHKIGQTPDMDLLRKVTIGCGPAIYNRDASVVSGSDPSELATVKTNFLIKKLGLDDGPQLDAALAKVMDMYGKSERNKYRAVVYYLLTQHFSKEAVYNASASSATAKLKPVATKPQTKKSQSANNITSDTVRKIARLSRLHVDEDRLAPLADELNGILGWIEQLAEVDVEGVLPMTSAVEMPAPLRADKVTDGGIRDKALANAPKSEDGFFVVPRSVE